MPCRPRQRCRQRRRCCGPCRSLPAIPARSPIVARHRECDGGRTLDGCDDRAPTHAATAHSVHSGHGLAPMNTPRESHVQLAAPPFPGLPAGQASRPMLGGGLPQQLLRAASPGRRDGSRQRPSRSKTFCTFATEMGNGSAIAPTWAHTPRRCPSDLIAPMAPAATPRSDTGLPASADGKPEVLDDELHRAAETPVVFGRGEDHT